MEMIMYRVMLQGEDGCYCLRNGFHSLESAEDYANRIAGNYGEGQSLYIEQYNPFYAY